MHTADHQQQHRRLAGPRVEVHVCDVREERQIRDGRLAARHQLHAAVARRNVLPGPWTCVQADFSVCAAAGYSPEECYKGTYLLDFNFVKHCFVFDYCFTIKKNDIHAYNH